MHLRIHGANLTDLLFPLPTSHFPPSIFIVRLNELHSASASQNSSPFSVSEAEFPPSLPVLPETERNALTGRLSFPPIGSPLTGPLSVPLRVRKLRSNKGPPHLLTASSDLKDARTRCAEITPTAGILQPFWATIWPLLFAGRLRYFSPFSATRMVSDHSSLQMTFFLRKRFSPPPFLRSGPFPPPFPFSWGPNWRSRRGKPLFRAGFSFSHRALKQEDSPLVVISFFFFFACV